MKFTWKEKEYYIDGFLADQLNSLCYNVQDDWDFVIIITGDRAVRVGKSVLALTVSAYLAYVLDRMKLNPDAYNINNIYFDNKKMVHEALNGGMYVVRHYDEGREGLAASKSVSDFQKDLLDFFAECGQLRNIFVVVLPDFFELKEEIAVARSECLINVYRKDSQKMVDLFGDGKMMPVIKFDRGQFEFFSRNKKRMLYDLAKVKKMKNYNLVKANFIGSFTNQYTVDEEKYKAMKKESLARFSSRHAKELKAIAKDEKPLTKAEQRLYDAIQNALARGEEKKKLQEEAMVTSDFIRKKLKRMEYKLQGQNVPPPVGN